nr:immunoglobulin light chain junction region [Mus musculus]
CQHSRELLTF